MQNLFFALGSGLSLLGVAFGAFGAHTLESKLKMLETLETFEIAVRYQMYHSLGLIAAAWAVSKWQNQLTAASGWCFFAGILIFSGSLYVLSLTGIRWLGAITPIGGLAFIVGWGCLTVAAIRGG
jgi:uncharacterized membrane protein YgdD (TMEM256/DUF423 family)